MPKKKITKKEIVVKRYDGLSWMYSVYEPTPEIGKNGKPSKSPGEMKVVKQKYPGRIQWVVHSLLDHVVDEKVFKYTIAEKKEIYKLADDIKDDLEAVLNRCTERVIAEIKAQGIRFE